MRGEDLKFFLPGVFLWVRVGEVSRGGIVSSAGRSLIGWSCERVIAVMNIESRDWGL